MIKNIILRFRDIEAQTIVQHKELIARSGSVWWGWWRKAQEPNRLEELAELKQLTKEGGFIEIGLFDRSDSRFFSAQLAGCAFDKQGNRMKSPEKVKTPKYYRTSQLPAWFNLVSISQISEEEFIQEFGNPPLEDLTFFPLSQVPAAVIRDTNADIEPILLKGSSIIHLSDLHFGDDFGFPSDTRPGLHPLMSILENDIKAQVDDVGLIIVSGDLTTRGNASYLFSNAKPFLHELAERLGLDPRNVVIVPGNHDIPLDQFTKTYDHEEAFNTFLNAFYGCPWEQLKLLKFNLPSGKILEILPINSVKLRSKETSNYGWVEWQSYDQLLKNSPLDANTLRIGVLHHHLVPTLKEERLPSSTYAPASVSMTLNAAEIIEGLQKHGFKVAIHGHQHTPALNKISRGRYRDDSLELDGFDESLFIIAGGSTGVQASRVDGDIRDNTYGILRIEEDHIVHSVRQFNPSNIVRTLYTTKLSL